MSDEAPIGVFDSGLGGLSVARAIRERLPGEPLLYFADTGNCPYGGRTLEEVRELSLRAVRELSERGAKLLVVACNTASGAALEVMRQELRIPVVGLEPAVRPAARLTRTGRIAVLATAATLRTDRFRRLLDSYAGGVTVYPLAGTGLVELVEEGELSGPETDRVLTHLLRPLIGTRVDTLVLGCTHYPFLREEIGRVMGPEVEILDSGAAVARQVERVLRERGLTAEAGAAGAGGAGGALPLLTTGEPEWVGRVAERLWGGPVRTQAV